MGMSQDTVVVLIAGAGMAGLMAGRLLHPQKQVLFLDKRPYIGGRMITRPVGTGFADIGAQFFTVRTSAFQRWNQKWLAAGLVEPWSTGWSVGAART